MDEEDVIIGKKAGMANMLKCFLVCIVFFIFSGLVYSVIYIDGANNLLNVSTGTGLFDYVNISMDLRVNGTITGGSPIKVAMEGIQFVNESLDTHYSIYHAMVDNPIRNVSSDFIDSLIIQGDIIENPYGMHFCLWDKLHQEMHFCVNADYDRATTFRGSLQLVGNDSVKEDDINFTLCEGADYIDCLDSDLFVNDDLEAQSIYSNENIVVDGNIDVAGVMTGTISLGCTCTNISGGNITYETFYMSVLGENDNADDLVNILGGGEGDVVNIFPTSGDSDITLIDAAGNLDLNGANCALKSLGTKAELRKVDSIWKLIVCLT